MVREDLVNSAVSFLQDQSVASAPLAKRIAFLQSKNLTQEEIDVSLARAGSGGGSSAAGAPASQQNFAYNGPPPSARYGQYQGYWQPPPPELPRRDWRDWFIMATVMGGVGFGLYVTAKRYIVPLIKPPTPPQLTQDKESIDEAFTKAFALLDQLETDTKTLKDAEVARTSRLDAALSELETVVSSLKDADRKREDDARRNGDEIRLLRDLIPKALESEKTATENRLGDLTAELKSLKTLMSNRMGNTSTGFSLHRPTGSFGASNGAPSPVTTTTGAAATAAASPATTTTAPATNGQTTSVDAATGTESTRPATPKSAGATSFPRLGGGARSAAIPAWQMAAKKDSQENLKDTSASGTATEETSAST